MLLRRLTHDIRRQLLDTLVGVYLYGSLVAGDFDHERSDLDLLAVVSAGVGEQDVERLRRMHARLVEDHPAWNDRIEVAYASLAALQTFRIKTSLIARISPGEPLHFTEAGREYLLDWYVVRYSGVALFGPPPRQVIPEIERAEFVEVVREHAKAWKEWMADMRPPREQAYAVLTICRALYTSTHGEQVSKKQAARSVQPMLPEWTALIEWALGWWYEGGAQTAEQDMPLVTVRFVEDVVSRIPSVDEESR